MVLSGSWPELFELKKIYLWKKTLLKKWTFSKTWKGKLMEMLVILFSKVSKIINK